MAKIKERIPFLESQKIVEQIKKILEKEKIKFGIYGSYIRKEDTIGDIDILVNERDYEKTKNILRNFPFYERLEIYYLPEEYMDSWESFALYLIGSGKFNVWLRGIAKRKNFLLNQYGLFSRDTGELIATKEKEIFEILGIRFIPYEKRKEIYKKEWKDFLIK
uniref:DNA polymerase beta domain protein region n=1 Tax=Thermodesulfobacterium geofontis TaxID=1295609 RepID=A0A7V4JP19_9BACT